MDEIRKGNGLRNDDGDVVIGGNGARVVLGMKDGRLQIVVDAVSFSLTLADDVISDVQLPAGK